MEIFGNPLETGPQHFIARFALLQLPDFRRKRARPGLSIVDAWLTLPQTRAARPKVESKVSSIAKPQHRALDASWTGGQTVRSCCSQRVKIDTHVESKQNNAFVNSKSCLLTNPCPFTILHSARQIIDSQSTALHPFRPSACHPFEGHEGQADTPGG